MFTPLPSLRRDCSSFGHQRRTLPMPLLLLPLLPSFGPRYPMVSLLPSLPSLSQPKCQLQFLCSVTQPCLSTSSTLLRKMSRIWPFLFVANPQCSRAAPSLDGRSINRASSRRSSGNNTMHQPPPPDERCNCTFSKSFAKSKAMVPAAGSSSRALWRKPSISNATSHKVRSSPSACVEAALQMKVSASLNSLKTTGLSHFHSLTL